MTTAARRMALGFVLCAVSVPLQFLALDARLSRQALAAVSIVMAVVGLALLLASWMSSRHD